MILLQDKQLYWYKNQQDKPMDAASTPLGAFLRAHREKLTP
ncbi:XRE family transcriptional regulator, partial [Pseudomonas sp. MWU12-2115]